MMFQNNWIVFVVLEYVLQFFNSLMNDVQVRNHDDDAAQLLIWVGLLFVLMHDVLKREFNRGQRLATPGRDGERKHAAWLLGGRGTSPKNRFPDFQDIG